MYRILLVCDSLSIGGAERHVIGLAAALRRRGHDVTMACSIDGPLGHRLADSGIALHALADRLVKRRASISYARLLDRLIRGRRFDLVHAHMHASAVAAAVISARRNVPLVITEHSEASWRDERARQTSRSTYRRAEQVIAVSSAIARRLKNEDFVPAGRVAVIRNALPPVEETREWHHPLIGPSLSGEPLIGTVARLVPEKGIACFLDAAAFVSRALPRARFVIVGDGPLRGELLASAAKLGLASRVHFLGARLDGMRLIAELDVLAIPSLSNEGTPLVTLEALSAGVPVVASAVGGIPEQVKGFERVTLVRPGDAGALGRALIEIAKVPRRKSPSTGHPRAIELLPGHEAMVRETEAVYARACARSWHVPATASVAVRGRWLAR
ncbi:MAG TPA: glycosyltransferase [Candidatus Limnocylindria bacterium]